MKNSRTGRCFVLCMISAVLMVSGCSKGPEAASQPAKAPESKDRTYRSLDGHTVFAIVSSDEIEIRQAGENIVCKYTEKDHKLRIVVSALGTTTAKYYNITPKGLVGEEGDVLYNSEAYEEALKQRSITSACKNNLRMISAAVDQYALDHQNKAPASLSDLCGSTLYIRVTPVCPAGGTYKFPAPGDDAECSIDGHAI